MPTKSANPKDVGKKNLTRRARFLAGIEQMTPWAKLERLIEPHYPKVVGAGRRPIGVTRMLRMYIAHQCFGLSDEGIEDAVYDSQAIRSFVGVELGRGRESVPDETTLLKFRHLLEEHGLTRQIFETINACLAAQGLTMREGTIVDATLTAAPPSTKNQDKQRDSEMYQPKKGNDWHFGMKAHIDVDAASGLVHTLIGTEGNVADVTQARALLHDGEVAALADAGYQGVEKREESKGKLVVWHVAVKRAKRKALPTNKLGRLREKLEKLKASVRAKVEHPFHVIKNLFRHRKTRYRGLAKNTVHLLALFGLANFVLAGRRFALPRARVVECFPLSPCPGGTNLFMKGGANVPYILVDPIGPSSLVCFCGRYHEMHR